jgi:2-dehydro-3-deoxyphosphogluconate aldolase / (4S)-4-hydroxy-2-oxoglutarate aldolase
MKTDPRQELVAQLKSIRVIAVLRAENAATAVAAARAILAGGVRAIEVTMTVPNAYEAIRSIATDTPAIVGAGTVVTADEVDHCIEAGARFIVSPGCCPDVIERAKSHRTLVIPGAMTPTEVLTAWRLGADMVKIFPAARLGPEFLCDLRGPLPNIPLVPTGGITDGNARDYLDAGATLVCVGSWLADRQSMAEGRFERLTDRARRLRDAIRQYEEDPHG